VVVGRSLSPIAAGPFAISELKNLIEFRGMQMVFTTSYVGEPILFDRWAPTNIAAFVGSFFAIVLVAFSMRLLIFVRSYLNFQYWSRSGGVSRHTFLTLTPENDSTTISTFGGTPTDDLGVYNGGAWICVDVNRHDVCCGTCPSHSMSIAGVFLCGLPRFRHRGIGLWKILS
jgi:hypothetical protein